MATITNTMDEYQLSSVDVKLEVDDEMCDVTDDDAMKNTNDDVQRAIEGLKGIPDEELQEFLNDEDFMDGLDVVDAWDRDEDKKANIEEKASKERTQRHPSRERVRRERRRSGSRERLKDKKREEVRRDPLKSTKDIERDKIRAKRDNESKLLAEKERAIKNLLDSDNVVPPGTETEAIQNIAKQNMERARLKKSKERRRSVERQKGSPPRRRSLERGRISPSYRRRSPFITSPERRRSPYKHRSPFRISSEKRRSPGRFNSDRRSPFISTPERRRSPLRRFSRERRFSADRRWSTERHRRRLDVHDRRRSPSRERQRSRSLERIRRRVSRSPRRYSPRRRSRSRSRSRNRSRSRSLERRRKRSPFINEIERQFRNEVMMTSHTKNAYEPSPIAGPSVLSGVPNASMYQQEAEARPLPPPQSYLPQPQLRPPVPGLPLQHIPPPPPTFMNFDMTAQQMNFDSMSMQPMPPAEYSSGPVMYNQANTGDMQQSAIRPPILPAPVPSPVPAPVPAPTMDHNLLTYAPVPPPQSPSQRLDSVRKSSNTPTFTSNFSQNYKDRRSPSPYDMKPERIKTPEPPIISNTKQFEKTSLSSLLEASVSAKDSTGPPVLYPGFKPEILRHCEHALRELPLEDPRLKMKGRFFFNPKKDEMKDKPEEHKSNSILLQKKNIKTLWLEEEEQHMPIKLNVQTHQKICQTEKAETEMKSIQTNVPTTDFEMQVYPDDLEQATKEEKKPIMDRLDWNVRETYEYAPKYREADDLRWSLNNSSQRRSWQRGSTSRRTDDHIETDRDPSPFRGRDNYVHKSSIHDRYSRERYSPEFRRSIEREEYHEIQSNHSRGESPMVLDESSDELEEERIFRREPDWYPRGKPIRGRSNPVIKPHLVRGKYTGGRPYRGRGNYRGKF